MVAGVAAPKLKREDCKFTKHGHHFCKWEILIGPSDWEDYLLGKEGAERYRVHNLPKILGPGLYELGIAISHTRLGRNIAKLNPDHVIVVYLGQADNVRTRLQQYGRSGAHLGYGSQGLNNDKAASLKRSHGLFEEIFSRGFPIVYRWAPMQNKKNAQATETQLLRTFDYAWNTCINGARRHDEILQKLEKIPLHSSKFRNIAKKLLAFTHKQVGIKIETSPLLSQDDKPSNSAEDESYTFLSRVFKFSRIHPRLVVDISRVTEPNDSICGLALGDGSVCSRPPVKGRKRCYVHKGMKIDRSLPKSVRDDSFSPICGVVLLDGSPCRRKPDRGRKRCDEHKGRRIH